jgi:DNA-binding MarR family transcriptional regulator
MRRINIADDNHCVAQSFISSTITLCNNLRMNKHDPGQRRQGAAFLLAQVGAHAAARFAELLAPLHLSPPHAGILRVLSKSAGLSQQELALMLNMHPSRLVGLVDELETSGFVKRQENMDDRRTYALHLTDEGRAILGEISRIAQEHQDSLLTSLGKEEREQLTNLLQRIADEQGLTPGVHPGFSRIGRKGRPKH